MNNVFTLAGLGLMLSLNLSAQKEIKEDSLKGFDEQAVLMMAQQRGIELVDMEGFMKVHKHEFINNKYGIKASKVPATNNYKIMVANCVNEDFENSSPGAPFSVPSTNSITAINGINGWVSEYGNVATTSTASCGPFASCCTGSPTGVSVIAPGPGGLIDPIIGSGYPIYSVYGNSLNSGGSVNSFNCYGDFFLKINSTFGVNRVSKSFSVTAANALFEFAFITVHTGAHCCCDAAASSIKIKDCANNLLPVTQYSFAPSAGGGCPGAGLPCMSGTSTTLQACTGNPGALFNPWNKASVNLTAYIGTCVTVEVLAFCCPYLGHTTHAYFDAQCGAAPTGLFDETNNSYSNIKLFPNPNSGEFTLSTSYALEKGELKIQNMLGQKIFSQAISQGETKIKTDKLAKGVYYYLVLDKGVSVGKGKLVIE
jgi:hypothetical protein